MQDLDLANPTRQVLHAGPLFRQNDPLKRSWKELWVILFDNYRTSSARLTSTPYAMGMLSGNDEAEGEGEGRQVCCVEACESLTRLDTTCDVEESAQSQFALNFSSFQATRYAQFSEATPSLA